MLGRQGSLSRVEKSKVMAMSRDDIIYAILLLLGIGFGHYYKRIKDGSTKKLTGTAFGLAIILFTSGIESFHLFFTFLSCFAIIKLFEA